MLVGDQRDACLFINGIEFGDMLFGSGSILCLCYIDIPVSCLSVRGAALERRVEKNRLLGGLWSNGLANSGSTSG